MCDALKPLQILSNDSVVFLLHVRRKYDITQTHTDHRSFQRTVEECGV